MQPDWDKEYASGAWERLRQPREIGHYAVQAGFATHYGLRGDMLEIGCGEGLLSLYLSFETYTGVDISSEAVAIARRLREPNTTFIHADFRNWNAEQKFDCIFFSECLHYFGESAPAQIEKTRHWLKPGGIVVTSWSDLKPCLPEWEMLERFSIGNKQSMWYVTAYRPK